MNEKIKNYIIISIGAIIIFGGMLMCLFLPRDSYSESERRELEKFPVFSVDSLTSGDFTSGFEKYATDNFPFRDGFRSIKAYTSYYLLRQKDNNGIYIDDSQIVSIDYPYNEKSVEYAASRFEYIYKNHLSDDNKVYLSVIPDKNSLIHEKAGALGYDSNILASSLSKKLPFAQYIDITSTLTADDYYNTDSHWKQECITDTADTIANAMGANLQKHYFTNTSDSAFYGVYYGQAALGGKGDSISYLTNGVISSMTAYDHQNEKDIPIYDVSRLEGRDPYEMFLSGSLSLVTIDNLAADNDKHLVLFRDSFGSSIAPLLAQGYSKVTLVDIRYINVDYVCSMIDFKDADVLFLYSSSVLNNSNTIK